MRDPARIERIGEKLIRAWKVAPDMRLLQLLIGLPGVCPGLQPTSFLFQREDDFVESALDKFLATHTPEPPQ